MATMAKPVLIDDLTDGNHQLVTVSVAQVRGRIDEHLPPEFLVAVDDAQSFIDIGQSPQFVVLKLTA